MPKSQARSTSRNRTITIASHACVRWWINSVSGNRRGLQKSDLAAPPYDAKRDAPKFAIEDVYGLLNPAPGTSNVYDMHEVIARIVDRSEFDEYKEEFGRTVLCGYARIGGHAVGIVANQKTNQNQIVAMGPQQGQSELKWAASYTPRARRRLPASSWTAIRTWCRSSFCTM